jgi:hypothetical protein
LLDEAHAMLFCQLAVLVRIDNHQARFVIGKCRSISGKVAFADRAEADPDNGAGNFRVDWRSGGLMDWSPERGCAWRKQE